MESKARRSKGPRRLVAVMTAMAMAVIFGAWEAIPCADQPAPPVGAVDSSNGGTHAKRGLTTRMLWVWANGTVAEFDIADQRSFISWGYNVNNHSIPWIDKSGLGRCLTPVGSCSVLYGQWRTEVCDRNGNDTCLFRREAQHNVSFTYGVAFNRYLTSCVGTRINWDGTHSRNAWGGDCSSQAQSLTTAMKSQRLTVGTGKNEVRVDRYLSRPDIQALDRACISKTADRVECGKLARSLYRKLPTDVRRSVKGAL